MNERDFQAVIESIHSDPDQENRAEKIARQGLRATTQFVGAGAVLVVAAWMYDYLGYPLGLWALLALVAVAIAALIGGTVSLRRFEETAKFHDRGYFLKSIEAAETCKELEDVGLPLSENLVSIAADALAEEWDVFGSHNEARERMLAKLHSVADLRKLADQVEDLEQQSSD